MDVANASVYDGATAAAEAVRHGAASAAARSTLVSALRASRT